MDFTLARIAFLLYFCACKVTAAPPGNKHLIPMSAKTNVKRLKTYDYETHFLHSFNAAPHGSPHSVH